MESFKCYVRWSEKENESDSVKIDWQSVVSSVHLGGAMCGGEIAKIGDKKSRRLGSTFKNTGFVN